MSHSPLTVEILEDRLVPSIVWVNRLGPGDSFTPAERAVVDQALAAWNQRLDLGYLANPYHVGITGGGASGLDLGGTTAGFTDTSFDGSGLPTGATIKIDANGGGLGLYVDPNPLDNGEYLTAISPFQRSGGPVGSDMYSTLLHELAHAIGFGGGKFDGRLVSAGGNFTYVGKNGLSATIDGSRGHVAGADLMQGIAPGNQRFLISDLDAALLSDAYVLALPPAPPPPPPPLPPGNLELASTIFSIAETAGSVTVTVIRTGGSNGTVSVQFATGDATASQTDYVATSGTLTFAAGATAQTFTIPLLADDQTEGTEAIALTLSNPGGGAGLGSRQVGAVFIDDVPTANERYVRRLFQDVLQRAVDPGAVAFWTGRLESGLERGQLALALASSAEYRARSIRNLFPSILGRPGDEGGVQFYLAFLNAGGTLEQVKAGLLGSQEFFSRAGNSAAGFLGALYQSALGRPIDNNGASFWLPLLTAGTLSHETVAQALVTSPEGRQAVVTAQFRQLLGRAPEPDALAFFTTVLGNGLSSEQLLAQIAGSQEYFAWP